MKFMRYLRENQAVYGNTVYSLRDISENQAVYGNTIYSLWDISVIR